MPSSLFVLSSSITLGHQEKHVLDLLLTEVNEVLPVAVVGEKDEEQAIGTVTDYDGTELETNVTEPEDLTYEEQVEATPYVAAVEATYDEDGNG